MDGGLSGASDPFAAASGTDAPDLRGAMVVRAATRRGLAALGLALLACAGPLAAQAPAALEVVVREEGGAAVAQATVRARRGGAVVGEARTGADGVARLEGLAPGGLEVEVQAPGYRPVRAATRLVGGATRRLTVALRREVLEVAPLEVRAPSGAAQERRRFEEEAGTTARVLAGPELKLLPGLGEADLLRAIEVLPGVVTTSDLGAAFHVRGGAADENLVLLDGFPILHPFHLGGVFSVFQSDVVAQAELLSGGFGAEYGGRTASVLRVDSRAAGRPGWEAAGGVSLLASRVAVWGTLPASARNPLGGEGGSVLVAARRSYVDVVLRPITPAPYAFTDGQLLLTAPLPAGHTLQLVGYAGQDGLDLSAFDPDVVPRLRWAWGNAVLGLRWAHGGWSAWAGRSRFRNALRFLDVEGARFGSGLTSDRLGVRWDGERGAWRARAGAELERLRSFLQAEAGGTEFGNRRDGGTDAAAYLQLSGAWGAWRVDPGVRLERWQAGPTVRWRVSPRLALKRYWGDGDRRGAAKLSLGRLTQVIHSLRNEDFPLSIDSWIPADSAVPVRRVWSAAAGVEQYWGDRLYAAVELYGRRAIGVTEFNLNDDPSDRTDDLLYGDAWATGADLFVRRRTARAEASLSVSYLVARRRLPDPLRPPEEPATIVFPPPYDRRWDVDATWQGRLGRGWELGLRWTYGSGLPYTRPIAQIVDWSLDLQRGRHWLRRPPVSVGDSMPLLVVIGPRGGARYPPYHRLDLTVRRTLERRWGVLVPCLQILNVYNRRNVLVYFYRYDRSPPTRSGLTNFPLLPTIGVDVRWGRPQGEPKRR